MSKSKTRSQKEEDIKQFIKLTWEIVRRNPEYQDDYRRYSEDYENNPNKSLRTYPLQGWIHVFDPEKGRYVSKDNEEPDPERCNRPYMIQRWGFFLNPDEPTPHGGFWQLPFSKEWKEIRRKHKPPIQPLFDAQTDLQKLPGVLKVEKWPEFQATSESLQKYIDDDLKPFISPPLQWETKDLHLNITVNLGAPSYLILHAVEFLVEVCKADLKLRDKDIEWDMIPKYLEARDLQEQELSDKEISGRIPLKRTKPPKESTRPGIPAEYREADKEIEGEENYNIARIKDYIKKAQSMIDNGSII